MKPLWVATLLFCICIIVYLLATLEPSEGDINPHFGPSPTIRVQLNRSTEEVSIAGDKQGFDIWFAGADRPLYKKGNNIIIRRSLNKFSFAGINQDAAWLEVTPRKGAFKIIYNNKEGSYPGRIRLYPVKDKEDRMSVINILELEPYVSRVIDGEMNRKWPLETLKTQAIIARTFALYHIDRPLSSRFDVYGYSLSQAYSNAPASLRAIRSVRETQNIVLEYGNKPMVTYYVNTCGGQTVSVKHVNPHTKPITPLGGVTCPHCKNSPYYQWQYEIDADNLAKVLLGSKGRASHIRHIELKKLDEFRVTHVVVTLSNSKRKTFAGNSFRKGINKFAGREKLRSLNFGIAKQGSNYIIYGRGWGHHGIGLCQYGAKQMGIDGRTAAEILSFYYPKSSLVSYNWKK